jgi:hypothetical protein
MLAAIFLASQWHFLANKHAVLAGCSAFWPVNCIFLHKKTRTRCTAEWPFCYWSLLCAYKFEWRACTTTSEVFILLCNRVRSYKLIIAYHVYYDYYKIDRNKQSKITVHDFYQQSRLTAVEQITFHDTKIKHFTFHANKYWPFTAHENTLSHPHFCQWIFF